MKIRRLLHPTDFSSASGPAFKLALELAKNRATLLLLHVLPPVPLVPDVYVAPSVYERLRQAHEQSARQRLDRLRLKAATAGVRASAVLRDASSPPEEIVRVARAKRIDIIVMGTHGRGGIAKMFLGSVAERVVRTATRPVLTVRGSKGEGWRRR
jgi:nucleotide-binding universal stress UspA family protein